MFPCTFPVASVINSWEKRQEANKGDYLWVLCGGSFGGICFYFVCFYFVLGSLACVLLK